MIKNPELLVRFETEELKKERLSYREAMKIFKAMWQEAVSLGALPLKDPLEDIETDIKLAKILNSCSKRL